MTKRTRRNLLKGLAVSAPAAWSTPLVTSVILPAHAQTSPCGPSLSCSTDDPVSETTVATGTFSGSGSNWGFNSNTNPGELSSYQARISGLQALACPGTDVTISIVDQTGDGSASVFPGQTVPANGSGLASFTETVGVQVTSASTGGVAPVNFTLRFTSNDGSGPCDIPFCFTEFDPSSACGKAGGP